MTNGIKSPSPHAWSNILLTTNLQVHSKGILSPDIRNKYLQERGVGGHPVGEAAEAYKDH